MRQDVLDLHGQVVGQLRVSGVGLPQQVHRIPGSVEKVRIAECHVLDPVGSELVDVRQHGIRPDHPHPPVVDDGDRAMATAVPASVRSLDCGSETRLAHPLEMGVVVVRGQRGSLAAGETSYAPDSGSRPFRQAPSPRSSPIQREPARTRRQRPSRRHRQLPGPDPRRRTDRRRRSEARAAAGATPAPSGWRDASRCASAPRRRRRRRRPDESCPSPPLRDRQ